MRTRITSAIFVAVVVLALTTALFNRAPGADATQGQPLIAGQTNTATTRTNILHTAGSPPGCEDTSGNVALVGCGANTGLAGVGGSGVGVDGSSDNIGARGIGGNVGVSGSGPTGVYGNGLRGVYGNGSQSGVSGNSSGTGYGVEGTQSSNGIGVYGHVNNGGGSGVRGDNTGEGPGVFGIAPDGIGVSAYSSNGTALKVDGKAEFSRSGTATVVGTAAAPKSSVTVKNVALTDMSLILVTPQKYVAGAWVAAAVPNVATGRFTLHLNKNISVGFPVAWMVIEKP